MIYDLDGVPKPLYRLPKISQASEVWLVEGEKDVATLEGIGLTATTVAGGVNGKWLSEYNDALTGKTVYVIADNDEPGRKCARQRCQQLQGSANEVVVVELPGVPTKGDVSDYIQQGHTADELKTLCEGQLARAKSVAIPDNSNGATGTLPTIWMCGGSLDANVRDGERYLAEATLRTPENGVFQRGGILVQIVRQTGPNSAGGIRRVVGALHIVPIGHDTLALKLNQAAKWERFQQRSQKWAKADVTVRVSKTLLSSSGDWPTTPVLEGVIEAPTMRSDGSVFQQPGYDSATGLYFDPGTTVFPAIPEKPTKADAQNSLDELREVIKEFPFAAEASRSVAIAAMMTPLIRSALRSAPMFVFSAPKMGTGKTLAASLPSYIATGRPPTLMSQSDSPEEEKKRLLAILLEGSVTTVIDNCERPLQSDSLCIVLTEPCIRERLLGSTKTITVPTTTTWFATGNNIIVSGDLTSRVLLCYLDPECERPEERPFDVNLHVEIPRRRGEIATAVLTIVRAYLCSGDSISDLPVYGRFEDWSRYVRESLVWLGLTDPCESRKGIEAHDAVREQLGPLLEAWRAAFGDDGRTIAEALKEIRVGNRPETESLNAAIRAIVGEKEPLNRRSLGKFIARHDRRVEGGLRFERDGKKQGALVWKVVAK